MKKFSICLIIILIGILAIVNNSYATISQDKISIKTEKILEQALKEYIEPYKSDKVSEEKRIKKSVLIKCLILISLAIICGLIILIPRINCIAGSCYSMYNSSSKYYSYNEKAVLPTISENADYPFHLLFENYPQT